METKGIIRKVDVDNKGKIFLALEESANKISLIHLPLKIENSLELIPYEEALEGKQVKYTEEENFNERGFFCTLETEKRKYNFYKL